jgi:hypothetical protein
MSRKDTRRKRPAAGKMGDALRFLRGRHVADRLEQPSVIDPVDPLERRELDSFDAAPWAALSDYLSLEKADDRFRKRVYRVPDAANRRLDAGFGESLRVANLDVLPTAIAVVNQLLPSATFAVVERLLEPLHRDVATQRARHPKIRRQTR